MSQTLVDARRDTAAAAPPDGHCSPVSDLLAFSARPSGSDDLRMFCIKGQVAFDQLWLIDGVSGYVCRYCGTMK